MYTQNCPRGNDFNNPSTTLGPKPNLSENLFLDPLP